MDSFWEQYYFMILHLQDLHTATPPATDSMPPALPVAPAPPFPGWHHSLDESPPICWTDPICSPPKKKGPFSFLRKHLIKYDLRHRIFSEAGNHQCVPWTTIFPCENPTQNWDGRPWHKDWRFAKIDASHATATKTFAGWSFWADFGS